jgi:hypothetical protein
MTTRGRLRAAGSRGVTVVEYSLIIAVFVFSSIGAIKTLNTRSGQYYGTASNDIGNLPQTGIDTSDEGTIPVATSTSTTTTTTTTSTTTSTTSTTTTTTTTIPTTTSTTTTTLPLRRTVGELIDQSSRQYSSWTVQARVKIVNNRTGAAISGTTVTIRLTGKSGQYLDKTCQTASAGTCSVSQSGIALTENPGTARVIGLSSGYPSWDGTQTQVVINY